MITICKTVHGSRLYGLATPTSDLDLKVVVLPSLEDCFLAHTQGLNKVDKVSGPTATDAQCYTLQKWMEGAVAGQDAELAMLHAGDEYRDDITGRLLLETSPTWAALVKDRRHFYTKSMGESRRFFNAMAHRYGVRKGGKLEFVTSAAGAVERAHISGVKTLGEALDLNLLPAHPEHGKISAIKANDGSGKMHSTFRVAGTHFRADEPLPSFYAKLRSLECSIATTDRKREDSIDLTQDRDRKRIMHAFRVGYQLRAIYTEGDYRYPLKETLSLREVRAGLVDRLDERLTELNDELDALAAASTLPEAVDQAWADRIITDVYYAGIRENTDLWPGHVAN